MDKMREEFEGWCKRELGFTPEWSSKYDSYSFVGTNDMWLSWKASRAALCVELPPKYNSDYPEPFNDGFDSAVEEIEETLYKCGVSYK